MDIYTLYINLHIYSKIIDFQYVDILSLEDRFVLICHRMNKRHTDKEEQKFRNINFI